MLEKPFWLKPPWMVLFDLIKLHRVRPWDVDIAGLLASFMAEMKKSGFLDFAVSGTALLSSSILLRLQSEVVMKLEEPPKPPEPRPIEFLPPPIQLPFRFEATSTTLDSLVQALEEAIRTGLETRPIKTIPVVAPPPEFFREYDQFFVEIESKIDDFLKKLWIFSHGSLITFSKVVEGKSRLETVRTFLLLLFLAARGKIGLLQDEEFGDIYVSFYDGAPGSGPSLTV